LEIKGEKKGTNTFKVSVPPGGNAAKFLKPVTAGEGTGLGMSYNYYFE
jgi:hypothetical protein